MWNKRKHPDNPPALSDVAAQLAQAQPSNLGQPDEESTSYYAGRGSTLTLKRLQGAQIEITTDADASEISACVSGWRSKLDKLIVSNGDGLSITGQPVSQLVFLEVTPKSSTLQRLLGLASGYEFKWRMVEEPEKDKLKLSIIVPEGTCVVLDDVQGTVEAKGRYGTVNAHVPQDTILEFEEVAGMELRTGMRCGIYIDRIGSCAAALAPETTLHIDSGTVALADIEAQHGCVVMLMARCESVLFAAEGHSALTAVVTGTLKAKVKANASLDITCDNAAKLDVDASSGCTLESSGTVARAAINAGMGSTITLGDVTEHLDARVGYNSSLATTAGGGVALANIKLEFGSALQLMGMISEGTISLGHDSTFKVGRLGSAVSLELSSIKLQTGYTG